MEDERGEAPRPRAALVEHLTGPSRGSATWLIGTAFDVSVGPDRLVRLSETQPGTHDEAVVARVHRIKDGYAIEAVEGRPLRVNGVQVAAQPLAHCDMVEFGETGPLSRYCLVRENQPLRTAASDILSDALAYLRVSRQPLASRAFRALRETLRRLTAQTTILFRVSVVLALGVLATLLYQQNQLDVLLQRQLDTGAARLDSFARTLTRARDDALTPNDLEGLRLELGRRLTSDSERLTALEDRSGSSGRVIAEAMSAVGFLQGAYGFREVASGRMLRHAVDADGRRLISPWGQPLLSLEGDGPVAEREFTGTGFVVGDDGLFVTNRHVALPWEDDASIEMRAEQDLEPVMIRFIVRFPGSPAARPVELLLASEDADLAVLRPTGAFEPLPGLRLADAAPAAGDEVIVMGYPTGLRSMLAQAGAAFVEDLQANNDTDFWSVAQRLADGGYIAPLASRGIVGQVTPATIVYDAETTLGGSGGPVLDIRGVVVSVNAAILPEFGGSNLGVPVAHVRELLAASLR